MLIKYLLFFWIYLRYNLEKSIALRCIWNSGRGETRLKELIADDNSI